MWGARRTGLGSLRHKMEPERRFAGSLLEKIRGAFWGFVDSFGSMLLYVFLVAFW